MKTSIQLMLCATMILLGNTAFAARKNQTLKGSGNIISKEVTLTQGYTSIHARSAVNVTMTEQEGDKVLIKADDNVLEWVVCKVQNQTLTLTIEKPGCTSLSNITVNITIPKNDKIKRIECAASAKVHILPTLKNQEELVIRGTSSSAVIIRRAETKFVDIKATSSANIQGAFKTQICNMDATSSAQINSSLLAEKAGVYASSSARIKLSGHAGTLNCDATSAGNINVEALLSQNASATATSSARIKLSCEESLTASASSAGSITSTQKASAKASVLASSGASITLACRGALLAQASSGGNIRYSGECKVESATTSSGGSIKKIN